VDTSSLSLSVWAKRFENVQVERIRPGQPSDERQNRGGPARVLTQEGGSVLQPTYRSVRSLTRMWVRRSLLAHTACSTHTTATHTTLTLTAMSASLTAPALNTASLVLLASVHGRAASGSK
jgi:hypothetical protein